VGNQKVGISGDFDQNPWGLHWFFFTHQQPWMTGWSGYGRIWEKIYQSGDMDGFFQQPGGFSAIDGDGMMYGMMYPLVNIQKAMKNGHL